MSETWKYEGDDERDIPALRLAGLKPGDTFEVDDKAISAGLEGQTMFKQVKASAKTQSTTTSKEG